MMVYVYVSHTLPRVPNFSLWFFGAKGRHNRSSIIVPSFIIHGDALITSTCGVIADLHQLVERSISRALATFPRMKSLLASNRTPLSSDSTLFFQLEIHGNLWRMLPQEPFWQIHHFYSSTVDLIAKTKELIDLESSYCQCQCKDCHDTKNTTTWTPWKHGTSDPRVYWH